MISQRSIVPATTMTPASYKDSNLTNKRSRSRAACKQCRQAKVRCGMEKIPCARCERRGFDCTWDPGFKRSNNPDRFQHLEGHLRALQQNVGESAQQTPSVEPVHVQTSAPPTSEEPASHSTLSADRITGDRPTQTPDRHSIESSAGNASCFRFLDIKLSRHHAEDLFAM